MTANIKGFLLEIGNVVVKGSSEDNDRFRLPKNSWQVNFTVENDVLKYEIMLRYDIFFQYSAHLFTDPSFWITNIAFRTGALLLEINPDALSHVQISFKVNNSDQKENDWLASCSVKDLIETVSDEEVSQGERTTQEARIMSIMDLSRA